MTKVSVCIPTFNGERFLGEAIRSVLSQTFADFELLVIDDASNDNTEDIARSFADGRLKYIQNPHRLGMVKNWNRCLELATGEFVAIFHQDDVMLPQNLQRKVDALDQTRQAGFVFSEARRIDSEGHVISSCWDADNPSGDCVYASPAFFRHLVTNRLDPICCPSVLLRRDCVEQVGGFDVRLAYTTDWEMWMRLSLWYPAAYIADPLILYRLHDKNETLNFSHRTVDLDERFRAKKYVLEKAAKRDPLAQSLSARIAYNAALDGVDLAYWHYSRNNKKQAAGCLRFGLRAKPRIVLTYRYLALVTKLALGERGSRVGSVVKQSITTRLHSQQG